MITLYKNDASEKYSVLHAFKAIETKKAALEDWHVDVEVPISDGTYLRTGNLIKVETKEKGLLYFRIKDIKVSGKKIIFNAFPFLYDLKDYVVDNTCIFKGATLDDAINAVMRTHAPWRPSTSFYWQNDSDVTSVSDFDLL